MKRRGRRRQVDVLGAARVAVDQRADARGEVGEIEESLFVFDAELRGHLAGIPGAEPEGYVGAGIAEDGRQDVVRDLRKILARKRQLQTVLAGFREDGGNVCRDDRAEFIEDEVERLSFVLFEITTGERRAGDRGNHEGTEEPAGKFADAAFAQVDDEDATLVHDLTKVDPVSRLADDVADRRVGKTGVELVADRRGDLISESGVPGLERFDPVTSDKRVLNFRDDATPVVITAQHAQNCQERRFACLHQSHEGVPQHFLGTVADGVLAKDVDERRNDVCGGGRTFFGRHTVEKVDADKVVGVPEVYVKKFGGAAGRDERHDGLGVFAVWVEKGESAAVRGDLGANVPQQNRLAGAGLTEDDRVPSAGDGVDRDRHVQGKATRRRTDGDVFESHGRRGALRRAGQGIALGWRLPSVASSFAASSGNTTPAVPAGGQHPLAGVYPGHAVWPYRHCTLPESLSVKREIGKKQKSQIRESRKREIRKSQKSKIERKRFVVANRLRTVEAATAELSHSGMLRHTVPSLPERARLNRVPLSSCVSPMKRRYLPVSL
jgi:hypothetical protein